jgi:hypothetical protein
MVSGKNNIHPYEIQTQNQNPEIYISMKVFKHSNIQACKIRNKIKVEYKNNVKPKYLINGFRQNIMLNQNQKQNPCISESKS